jgi:hypothetical protein
MSKCTICEDDFKVMTKEELIKIIQETDLTEDQLLDMNYSLPVKFTKFILSKQSE